MRQVRPKGKDFETDHIVSLANYIVDTWSGTPEAAEAINTLIPFLIRQGKLDKAREYVENIPPNSSRTRFGRIADW